MDSMEKDRIDEFGPVRDRRDFEPQQLLLKPILPCPSREFSFSSRTCCWQYSPPTPKNRLGSMRDFSDLPPTKVSIPEAWILVADDEEIRTRKRLKSLTLHTAETKRPRIEDTAVGNFINSCREEKATNLETTTVVTESTSSISSTGRILDQVARGSATTSLLSDIVPKAALYSYYSKKKQRKTQISNKQYHTWNNGARTHELKCVKYIVETGFCTSFAC